MGQFNKKRAVLGVLAESTPYTAATLSAGHFNVPFNKDITVSPEIEMAEQEYANGTFDRHTAIPGKRMGTIEASYPLTPVSTTTSGASLAAAPNWAKCWESAGMLGTIHTSIGYTLDTSVNNTRKPHTVEYQIFDEGNPLSVAGIRIQLVGAMATLKIMIDALGKPIQAVQSWRGRLAISDIAAGSCKIPSGFSTVIAPGVCSSTITVAAAAVDFSAFEIDMGIQLSDMPDPARAECWLGCNVTDMNPVIRMAPSMKLIATDSYWTKWLAQTTGALALTYGVNSNMHLSAPAIQINEGYKTEDIDNNLRNPVAFYCRYNASLPAFRFLQGAV